MSDSIPPLFPLSLLVSLFPFIQTNAKYFKSYLFDAGDNFASPSMLRNRKWDLPIWHRRFQMPLNSDWIKVWKMCYPVVISVPLPCNSSSSNSSSLHAQQAKLSFLVLSIKYKYVYKVQCISSILARLESVWSVQKKNLILNLFNKSFIYVR